MPRYCLLFSAAAAWAQRLALLVLLLPVFYMPASAQAAGSSSRPTRSVVLNVNAPPGTYAEKDDDARGKGQQPCAAPCPPGCVPDGTSSSYNNGEGSTAAEPPQDTATGAATMPMSSSATDTLPPIVTSNRESLVVQVNNHLNTPVVWDVPSAQIQQIVNANSSRTFYLNPGTLRNQMEMARVPYVIRGQEGNMSVAAGEIVLSDATTIDTSGLSRLGEQNVSYPTLAPQDDEPATPPAQQAPVRGLW